MGPQSGWAVCLPGIEFYQCSSLPVIHGAALDLGRSASGGRQAATGSAITVSQSADLKSDSADSRQSRGSKALSLAPLRSDECRVHPTGHRELPNRTALPQMRLDQIPAHVHRRPSLGVAYVLTHLSPMSWFRTLPRAHVAFSSHFRRSNRESRFRSLTGRATHSNPCTRRTSCDE
jgi:hypothetical protein